MRKKKNTRDQKKGNIDDIIEFERHGLKIKAKVVLLRLESVIVEFIDEKIASILEYGNNRTVVRDGNYQIIEKSNLPPQPIYEFNIWRKSTN